MNALLLTPLFDSFETVSVFVKSYALFSVEAPGATIPGENAAAPSWKQIRPVLVDILKGNKKPEQMKLVLKLSEKNTAEVLRRSGAVLEPEQIGGLFWNILYRSEDEKETVTGTTGTSLKIFTPDRSLEKTWDAMAEAILIREEIPFI